MLSSFRILDCSDRLGWLAGRILADLGAEVIKCDPLGTDRTAPDWQGNNVNKRVASLAVQEDLDRLLAGVDAVLTGGGWPDDWLDPQQLTRRYPQLVIVSITPWGLVGPRSSWRGTDLEIMAGGGAMSLAGEPGGMPLRVTAPQSYAWAGSQAATGCLVALFHQRKTGQGQVVDVSAQASVVIGLAHAPAFWDVQRIEATRAGAYMTGRSVAGARYRVFWPCADGYINFILYGGTAGRRTNEQLVAWMRDSGADPGLLGQVDWAHFDPTRANQEKVDALEAPIARFFAGITKRTFLDEAFRRSMLGYPVSNVADISSDPQLEARAVWQDVKGADSRIQRHVSTFVVVDGVRKPLRYAAGTPWTENSGSPVDATVLEDPALT